MLPLPKVAPVFPSNQPVVVRLPHDEHIEPGVSPCPFPDPSPAFPAEAGAALFTDARTACFFAGTPVDDATLTSIWELARWAPTAANTQPLRVLYVRTAEGKERLLPHLDEGNRPSRPRRPSSRSSPWTTASTSTSRTSCPSAGDEGVLRGRARSA